jgi:hypothetical protein
MLAVVDRFKEEGTVDELVTVGARWNRADAAAIRTRSGAYYAMDEDLWAHVQIARVATAWQAGTAGLLAVRPACPILAQPGGLASHRARRDHSQPHYWAWRSAAAVAAASYERCHGLRKEGLFDDGVTRAVKGSLLATPRSWSKSFLLQRRCLAGRVPGVAAF